MNTTSSRKPTRTWLRRTLVTAAAVTAFIGPSAFGWSRLGHWLVGDLAQPLLTPAAQAQVALLLKDEATPTLAGVASWADEIRSNGSDLAKKSGKWHYVDLDPNRCVYVPAVHCPDGNCVIVAIDEQRKILADTAQPPEARRDALKFIVHFIGDVHQPMHAGSMADAEGRNDSGGNKYQINLRTAIGQEGRGKQRAVGEPVGTNLHAVWDYYELESALLSPEAYATKLRKEGIPQIAPAALGTPTDWAVESCKGIAAQGLYPQDSDGQLQHKIGGAYLDAKRPYAEERIRTAAGRLAAVLNETLK